MSDSTISIRKAPKRLLVPVAVAVCIAGGAFFGIDSLAASQATDSAANAEPTERATSLEPTTTQTAAEPTQTAASTEPIERGARTEPTNEVVDAATGYTLADAAGVDDPRVADVECLYLSEDEDDPFVRVSNFRADRDRFFDIDSEVVQESRTDGLSFAEIAAEHGFSETEVGAGAAAMHGYCYQQLVGDGLTQQAAETRFQGTIARFTELKDAEPDASGRGAAGDGITNGGRADHAADE